MLAFLTTAKIRLLQQHFTQGLGMEEFIGVMRSSIAEHITDDNEVRPACNFEPDLRTRLAH